MNPLDNIMKASCIDMAIFLVHLISPAEAQCKMTRAGVIQAIIRRVLTRPTERRAIVLTGAIPEH
jgi:hypothetical protein